MRLIKRLEALLFGWTPPKESPPKYQMGEVTPAGIFGIFFDEDIAGLVLMEKLNLTFS